MKQLLMLVVMLSIVITPGLVAAQGDEFVCNLDEADCELLENTLTAMAGVQTVNADTFDFGFTLETGTTTDTISFVGSGPLDFSSTEGVEVDFTLDEFTTETDNFPLESGATALRIVDGMTYTFDGETWTSYTSDTVGLTELYSPANLLALAVGASDVVVWERGEDIEVDGRTLYVYTADIRFGDILASEEFADILDSQLESGDIPETEGIPTEMIGLMLGLLGTQLNQGTSQITFHISPEDNLVYGAIVDIDIAIDFATLLGGFGGGDDDQLPRLATDFDLTMTLSDYGEAVQIEAPGDAVEGDPISLADALISGLTGGMDIGGGGGGIDFGGGSDFDPEAVDAELAPDVEVTGVLTVENDSQFYRFTANEGDIVTITMHALNEDGDLDTYLRLLDVEGNRLAENDDAEDNPELGFFDSEIKNFEIPSDGEYFVEATWLFTSPDAEYGLILTIEE